MCDFLGGLNTSRPPRGEGGRGGEGHLSFGITTEITKLLAYPKTQSYNLNFLTAHMTIPLASAVLVTWHSFPFTKAIMMVHGLNALVFNCYSRILWEHLHLLSTKNVINNPLPCILSNFDLPCKKVLPKAFMIISTAKHLSHCNCLP